MQIHESAEDYLETILLLHLRNGQVRSIDIVNEMGYSKPSISVGLASSLMPKDAVAANDWEACAAYVRGMVDQIQR